MADFGGGGFLGSIGGILSGIAGFLRGFLAITVKDLLRLVQYLRDQLVTLGKQMLSAIWKAGKALARALGSLGRLAYGGLKQFVLWADKKFRLLEAWLKETFAPLLRFLKNIKDHIDDIYKRFVRPIIDTIEFIRQINRVLQVFHVHLLDKLDTTLQRLEQKIEEPFLWVRAELTKIQNVVDRIITLDGLVQRVTLLRSMSKYAPAWINGFWNRQIDPNLKAGTDYSRGRDYPLDTPFANGKELAQFYRRQPHAGQDRRARSAVASSCWH
jgi:hypothetical protein